MSGNRGGTFSDSVGLIVPVVPVSQALASMDGRCTPAAGRDFIHVYPHKCRVSKARANLQNIS